MSLRPTRSATDREVRADAPYGWRPAWVLTAINLVDGAESSVVIGALPLLQDEWGFSDTWAGALATAAAIAGLVALLPAGWLADNRQRGHLLGFVLATWALFTTASAVAVAFWMFFLIRVVLGAAMHLDNPPASSLLADSYAPALRGRIYAAQRLAYLVGIGVGIAIGGVVGDAFGWRTAFMVMVIPGLIVAYFCWRLPDPPRGDLDRIAAESDDVSDTELAFEELAVVPVEESSLGRGITTQMARVRETLRIPTVRRLYVGLTVAFLGFNGLAFWLPTFLERTHDVSEATASGVTAVLALIAGVGGAVVGGVLGDRLAAKGADKRIALVGISLILGAGALLTALAMPSFAAQAFVLTIAAFLLTLGFPNFAAAAADVLPAATRGTGFALFTFLLTLGSALGPLIVGGVSDATGSLGIALAVSALPTIPGAFVVLRARSSIAADIARARGEVLT
jgi:MFS family permease